MQHGQKLISTNRRHYQQNRETTRRKQCIFNVKLRQDFLGSYSQVRYLASQTLFGPPFLQTSKLLTRKRKLFERSVFTPGYSVRTYFIVVHIVLTYTGPSCHTWTHVKSLLYCMVRTEWGGVPCSHIHPATTGFTFSLWHTYRSMECTYVTYAFMQGSISILELLDRWRRNL